MKRIVNRFRNSTIKLKIILVFSVITILLVGTMARISYMYVRNIYQEQLSEQITLLCELVADAMETNYLEFIDINSENLAHRHYETIIAAQVEKMKLSNGFIFDENFRILLSINPEISTTRLLINRMEIRELDIGASTVSLPFKGEDDKWYMWGYHRLGDGYYLGIQENVDRLKKLEDLAFIFLSIGVLGVVVTAIAGILLAGSVARPIDRLVSFSEKIGAGEFKTTPPQRMYGELAILRNALVKMKNDLMIKQEEKENLLAQIAHEIRNPLGGIELLAGLIKEQVEPHTQNAMYLQKILDEIYNLKAQITAYLNYSRPVRPEPEAIHLPSLLEEIRTVFEKRLSEKNVTFTCDIQKSEIVFDRQHFRQILINLISNSLEAMNGKGAINIKSNMQGANTTVSLSDEGHGIPTEHFADLFKPFFTTKEGGTGLGLSICHKLCQENNAVLGASNNKDKGCTFKIILHE